MEFVDLIRLLYSRLLKYGCFHYNLTIKIALYFDTKILVNKIVNLTLFYLS